MGQRCLQEAMGWGKGIFRKRWNEAEAPSGSDGVGQRRLHVAEGVGQEAIVVEQRRPQ